ncbi:MAG: hypothetical protein RRY29_02585 [Desulfovibrionaceae bacterium]
MPEPSLHITVLDLQGDRLARAEQELRRNLRHYKLHAHVVCLACGLEIARSGYSGMTPVLLVEEHPFSIGRELSPALLQELCRRLALRQTAQSENESS